MSNFFNNPQVIAAETLMHLEDALVIANLTARDKTGEFTGNARKVGDVVDIRTEPDYSVNEFTAGGNITVQDIRTSKRPFAIEKHFDTSVTIGAREAALNLDSLSEQVLAPAAYRLAEKVDQYVGTKILQGRGLYSSADLFGTAGDIALGRKAATLQQLGQNRYCLLNLDLEAKLLGQDFFNQSQIRGQAGVSTLESARLGHLMGMDFLSSVNFPVFSQAAGNGAAATNNTGGTTNLVGLSVLTITALVGQIEAGDTLAIAGVRRPVVAAAQVLAGATSVPLVDPIDEIIPDGAAVTTVASGAASVDIQGAIFDGSSLALAMPALELPPSNVSAAVVSNNGFSIRVVSDYDINTKKTIWSLDLIVGATAWDARKITRLGEQS